MLLLLCLSSIIKGQALLFSLPPSKSTPPSSCLHASSSSSSDSEKNKNLSAAAKARREEDQRRLSRRNENIPGKTSALPTAKDFAIDPSATEQQWLSQASSLELQISRYTDEGMNYFKNLQMEEADTSFRKVYQLKPTAYVWQAGIVQFYLCQLEKAQQTFGENAARYESKFGEPATEERIWRDACALKIYSLASCS